MFNSFLNTIKQVLHLKKGIQHYADCIIRNEKGEILLLQRSGNDDFQPNKWCLPGGKIERGEVPEYAAARELLEETNLQTPLQFIQAVERTDSVSCYFEGYVLSSDYTILDNEEHFRCQWVAVEDIASYDLILDLKDILMNKIGIPIYSTKLMQLEILDANDLFKRNELVEKSFDADQMTTKDYFECKNIIKSHLDMIVEAAQEQGLLEKVGVTEGEGTILLITENNIDNSEAKCIAIERAFGSVSMIDSVAKATTFNAFEQLSSQKAEIVKIAIERELTEEQMFNINAYLNEEIETILRSR